MSYLEEWKKIEKKYGNTAKELALMHIAKCLSVIADDIVGDCKECKEATDNICCETCLHGDKSIHQDPCLSCDGYGGGWEPKKTTDEKPCNNCIHSNDEYEINCSVCDENHSEYKPFGFRGKKDEIEVACPVCSKIITVIKNTDVLALKCPSCGVKFIYDVDTYEYELYID